MANIKSGIITLLNTIIGAGILAMPFALRANGIMLGIFVIMLSGSASMFGLYLQNQCASYAAPRHASFFALAQITCPQLTIVFDLAIAVKCFGVSVSHLVIIGDLMPQIVASLVSHDLPWWLLNRNLYITFFMVFIVSPLSFLRRLDSLKYASMVALSSVAYLVVLVLVHFVMGSDNRGEIRIIQPGPVTGILSTFPIFVFAYTCHQNMFSIINELDNNSNRCVNKVIFTAISSAMCLYILVGVTGYVTFGDNVTGNIITMYSQSVTTTIGRIAIVILVMIAYPLQCHPTRASINHVIHYLTHPESRRPSRVSSRRPSRMTSRLSSLATSPSIHQFRENSPLVASDNVVGGITDDDNEGVEQVIVPLEGAKFYIITTCILLSSFTVAISVTSLATVLAFVGSTGSTSISFILPGIFGYQLIGSDVELMSRREKILKRCALGLTIWGFSVMFVCLTATIFFGATH